jgi:choline kinase
MKVVILAAGTGTRLGSLTQDKPKALLTINGTPIIDYQIMMLQESGFPPEDIFIITGHKSKSFTYLFERGLREIYNPFFETKNNIYSLYLAKSIEDELLIINSDVFFHRDILETLLTSRCDSGISVDLEKKLGEEEMKVELNKEMNLIRISKEMEPERASGEYIGLSRFSEKHSRVLFRCIDNLLQGGNEDYWYEGAFQEVLKHNIEICGVSTKGLPWIEIDTVEDYQKSQNIL